MSPNALIYWARRQSAQELASHARAYGDWLANPLSQRRPLTGELLIFYLQEAPFLRGGGRARLASRPGYWRCVGIFAGRDCNWPWGLGFISDVDEILQLLELGVVFLMVYHRP